MNILIAAFLLTLVIFALGFAAHIITEPAKDEPEGDAVDTTGRAAHIRGAGAFTSGGPTVDGDLFAACGNDGSPAESRPDDRSVSKSASRFSPGTVDPPSMAQIDAMKTATILRHRLRRKARRMTRQRQRDYDRTQRESPAAVPDLRTVASVSTPGGLQLREVGSVHDETLFEIGDERDNSFASALSGGVSPTDTVELSEEVRRRLKAKREPQERFVDDLAVLFGIHATDWLNLRHCVESKIEEVDDALATDSFDDYGLNAKRRELNALWEKLSNNEKVRAKRRGSTNG